MPDLTIPRTPVDLTPDWLTAALRETGSIKESTVTSFEMEPDIAAGAGFMGQLARVELRYDRPEPDAPASLIAKFPTYAPDNRALADVFRFYEMETRFYEEIAGEAELRTPRRYYSAMAEDSTDFILLIEDLAPARVGDQLASCSSDQAELAIRELAKFHATWWESPRLSELNWLWRLDDPVRIQTAQVVYGQAWGPFKENFGGLVPSTLLTLGEAFPGKIPEIMGRLAQPPLTISHGDYRLDNFFFATPEGGPPFAVVDWQVMSTGGGLFDVAYFMSESLRPDDRKANEMDLVRMYHITLTERGIQDYDFDRCWLDYRAATLFCWQYAVVIAGLLDSANERGVELFTAIVERVASALTDLDAAELMPS